MISHPSCFTSYCPILTRPSWFWLLSMWHHQTPCCIIIIIVIYITLSPCSLFFPFNSLTSICLVLAIAPHDPICPQVQGGCYQRYFEVISLFLPSLTLISHIPPLNSSYNANTSAAIQWENCELFLASMRSSWNKRFSPSPVFPYLLLLPTLITYYIIFHFHAILMLYT